MIHSQIQSEALTAKARQLLHRNPGAQVLQAGWNQLASVFYLSPLSLGEPGASPAPARGGVPVLFPQFADTGPLPKHGLVRTVAWRLLADKILPGLQQVHYELDIAPTDNANWPYAARLSLLVESRPGELTFALQVHNTGCDAFNWSGGLHPYFAVQDVLTSSATGLAGLAVQDRYDADLHYQPPGVLGWTEQPFERLYDASPPLMLDTGGYSLRLSARGFDQWMVWNPGKEGAQALADLPAADWQHFVCVEPVCVARPVVLAPGETFQGQLHIQLYQH